jgi:signal transduction histidine kinase/ActR/RegA family two-component response regulator
MDVTDRRQALEALAEAAVANQRLAAAVNAAGDAIVLTDVEGHITYTNSAFTAMSGWSLDEVRGRTPALLKSGRTDAAVYADLWATVRDGRQWAGRMCNRRKTVLLPPGQQPADHQQDALFYWIDTTITPMLDAGGRIAGYVAVQRDATAEVAAERSQALAREAAEARGSVAEILAAETPLAERLQAALAAVLRMSELQLQQKGRMFVLEPGSSRLRQIAHHGDLPTDCQPDASGAPGSCVCSRAASSRELVISDHCCSDGSCQYRKQVLQAHGHYAVPMRQGNDCHGLMLLYTEPQPSRDPARLQAMQQIGELMALALVRERTSQLLVEARERAETASRAKSEFLANMSHEIRSPMTAILGYTELLAEDGDLNSAPQRRLDYIQTIRRNGEHLLTIINDVLDLAKIEAGKLSIETIACSPSQILEDVRSLMQVRAIGKRIGLELVYATALPERIHTDPTRLRQVLMNLVGNAIKFTETGNVTMRAALRQQPRPMLAIEICDTGIGMSPEQLSRLFGAFEQADASTTRRFGGSGLGLRISLRLAAMLGGDIQVASEVGVGSTFTLLLPTGALDDIALVTPGDRNPGNDKPATAEARIQLDGMRVLLAEDGTDNRKLISHILRRAGARVSVVENGRQLLESLLGGRLDGPLDPAPEVDLIVTDMQMPEMDGYTATRMLRARGCELPIVALTAHAMADAEQGCIDAGCDAYASKPIDKAHLLQVCRDTVRARKKPG